MTTSPVTPADLSRELGFTQVQIRGYLRQQYGVLHGHETRWLLDLEQANDARKHFRELAASR